MLEAKRTLVKSGPELWAEVADIGCLARHLAPFGSIRIVRTQPETLVAWEGERASGRVRLAASGFGTRVVLEAEVADLAAPEPEPPAAPEPVAEAARPGFWSRLFRRAGDTEAPAAEPAPVAEQSATEPAMTDDAAMLVLTDMLDALGKAHHRPFSRV